MRTPKNILRHELIGLHCTIMKSSNSSSVGLSGKIVDETMKTIVLETKAGEKRVMKKSTIFRVRLSDAQVEIDGNYILSRPEDRIKKKFRKW